MRRGQGMVWRRNVRGVALCTGVALLGLARGSHAQQSAPTLAFSVPAAATRHQATRVSLTFALPPGLQLYDHPRVRVVDLRGRLVELLPATITQLLPAGAADRDLHSYNYPAGTYRVSVELQYRTPGGPVLTVSAPQRTLSVPG